MNNAPCTASAQINVDNFERKNTGTTSRQHDSKSKSFSLMEILSHGDDTAREEAGSRESKSDSLREEDVIELSRKAQHGNEEGTSDRTRDGDVFHTMRIDDSTKYCATSIPAIYDDVRK